MHAEADEKKTLDDRSKFPVKIATTFACVSSQVKYTGDIDSP